jgi:hypothetical protein
VALCALGLRPAEFWAQTPSETADLLVAFRQLENRRARQIGWELYHQMIPHLASGHGVTIRSLVEAMPIAFVDDLPKEATADVPPGTTPEQASELERRRSLKRVNRPQ